MSGVLLWTTSAFAGAPALPPRPQRCPADPVAVVDARIGEVEAAYVDNDIAAFDDAAEELARIVGCIDTRVDVDRAVALHHAMGLRAYVSDDSAAASRSLRAIRLLEPDWRTSSGWMTEGQPLNALYLLELPENHVTLPDPAGAELWVDGRNTDRVPTNEAFVLQVVDRREKVLYTGYHASVTTLPDLRSDHPARPVVRAVGSSVALGLLAGALVSELGALNARNELRDPSTPPGELSGLYSRSRALDTVAASLGAGGVATAGLIWVVPW